MVRTKPLALETRTTKTCEQTRTRESHHGSLFSVCVLSVRMSEVNKAITYIQKRLRCVEIAQCALLPAWVRFQNYYFKVLILKYAHYT